MMVFQRGYIFVLAGHFCFSIDLIPVKCKIYFIEKMEGNFVRIQNTNEILRTLSQIQVVTSRFFEVNRASKVS